MLYLDSSAVYKLIADELESRPLTAFLAGQSAPVSSTLARVEVGRALGRAQGRPWRAGHADDVLSRICLLALDDSILARAAGIGPPELRSLDAIHLATALSVPALEGMVVYDRRLARAAQAAGLRVWAPGRESG
ncbi:MAG TPA: type II toxin-antitoxin system VapC family toxin [Terriglobales bacterium]|jgi:predicted nucleic acid-binding protein